MRRVALLIVIVSVVGGLVATEASAHTLSVGRAKQAITNEVGFVFEDYYRASPTVGGWARNRSFRCPGPGAP